ncbi:DIP2, partial [Trypoxylus dichotomus]
MSYDESSSDEDSIVNEETVESTPEREKARDRSTPQMLPPPPLSDTSSTGSPPSLHPMHHRQRMPPPPMYTNWDHRTKTEITDITDVMQNLRP